MDWNSDSPQGKPKPQEIADEIIQIYLKTLQYQEALKSILSEFVTLDYFGECFHGQLEVSKHLMRNLQGSTYELSSVNLNKAAVTMASTSSDKMHDISNDDLGVKLISPPKVLFPSLIFETPNRYRSITSRRSVSKRNAHEASLENLIGNMKKCKMDPSQIKRDTPTGKLLTNISPVSCSQLIPADIKYISAYGTIRYSRSVMSTIDPKHMKLRSHRVLRDRFCQLQIGYQCSEQIPNLTNFKIWVIKYNISSRVTPKNLMKLFEEAECK